MNSKSTATAVASFIVAAAVMSGGCTSGRHETATEAGETPSAATGTGSFEYYFSLDIGSDTELSDPTPDGNEGADPGDIYKSDGDSFTGSSARDGDIDDSYLLGLSDPDPDAPDTSPPTTGAPVGGGCLPPGRPLCYREYFDLDAFDVINADLRSVGLRPRVARSSPIPETDFTYDAWKYCIEYPVYLAVSFDDDHATSWAIGDSARVPVESLSPGGLTHGTDEARDELVAITLDLGPAGGRSEVVSLAGIADEDDVHADLAYNPEVGKESYDDDVDALDLVSIDPCDVMMFSADHEGQIGLDPGIIYERTTSGYRQILDGEIHLGISKEADIDAFEFAWLDDEDGIKSLAFIYSVDDDDPRTPAIDESGGLDPAMLYASFLTGSSFELARLASNTDEVFYAIEYTGDLLQIDPATGAAVSLGVVGSDRYQGMAADSNDQVYTITDTGDIYQVDPSGPSLSGPVTLTPAVYVVAMAFNSDDELYVMTYGSSGSKADELLLVDKTTGTYTIVGGTTTTNIQGIAFNDKDELYGVGNAGDVYTIDKSTGLATLLGGPAVSDYDAQTLEFDSLGRLYRTRENFVQVDQTSWSPVTIGPTGFKDIRGLAIVGGHDVDVDAIAVSSGDLSSE